MSSYTLSFVKKENDTCYFSVLGRIDSGNANDLNSQFEEILKEHGCNAVEIDARELEYISSAGLRVLLKIKKSVDKVKIINVSRDIYEIFEMTGFVDILDVVKAFRNIDVTGCEIIGHGAFGTVYRLDGDTIIKVYDRGNSISYDFIKREQETAKKAFVYGIPTAISYDVVKVGEFYGVVYELIDAVSVAEYITLHPEELEPIAKKVAALAKKIHTTQVKEGEFQDASSIYTTILPGVKPYVTDEQYKHIKAAMEAVPKTNTLLHGDFHAKNILIRNGELELIDMGDMSVGHPIVEFSSFFLLLSIFEVHQESGEMYSGLKKDVLCKFTDIVLKEYFGERYNEDTNRLILQLMNILAPFRRVPVTCTRCTLRGDNPPEQLVQNVKRGVENLLKITPEAVVKAFNDIQENLF